MTGTLASTLLAGFVPVAILVANAFLMASLAHVLAERGRTGCGQGRFEPMRPVWDGIRLAAKDQGAASGIGRGVGAVPVLAALGLVLAGIGVVPFSGTFQVVRTDIGVLYLLGVLSMSVLWPFVAGWVSGESLAIHAGMRIAARKAAFVSALVLSVIPVVLYAGGFDLTLIATAQSGVWLRVLPRWFATFPMFWPPLLVFALASVVGFGPSPAGSFEGRVGLGAESSLAPTPFLFGLQRLVEHGYLFVISALTVLVFFGGWTLPRISSAGVAPLIFLFKVYAWAALVMWARGFVPAVRLSDLVALGWKWLVPLSFVWIVVCAVLMGFFDLSRGAS